MHKKEGERNRSRDIPPEKPEGTKVKKKTGQGFMYTNEKGPMEEMGRAEASENIETQDARKRRIIETQEPDKVGQIENQKAR